MSTFKLPTKFQGLCKEGGNWQHWTLIVSSAMNHRNSVQSLKKPNLLIKGHFNDMSKFAKTACATRVQLTPTLNEEKWKHNEFHSALTAAWAAGKAVWEMKHV